MSIPFLSVDQVIERALILLQTDERLRNSPVLDKNNKPISINRLRNFDGFDDNSTGITLSIYPYSYQGTSNETVHTKNSALVYNDYELGTQYNSARERCQLSLVVSLQTVGFDQDPFIPPTLGQIEVVRSEKERAMYKWLTIVWDILLRNPLSNLGGLVHASKVNWGAFHTTKWDVEKPSSVTANAVLHKATLLWQMELYTVRNFSQFLKFQTIPDIGSQNTWTYVGVRSSDCTPIYWDSYNDCLITVSGIPILYTPKQQNVKWDLKTNKFVDPTNDDSPLTYVQLEDPSLIPKRNWIDTNLLLVGVLKPSFQNLFWNKTLRILQLCDGTVIDTLPDGTTVIFYDPNTGQVVDGPPGEPGTNPVPPGQFFVSLKTGQVNIYDANSLTLRDSFLF